MTNVKRAAVIGVLLAVTLCATQNTVGNELVSPTATLEFNIDGCDLVEVESTLVKIFQAHNVSAIVLDERFREVNPPDVVTVLGESDGFDVDVSNFAEREVLSIAIYHKEDDPRKALFFTEKVHDLLPERLPCLLPRVRPESVEE